MLEIKPDLDKKALLRYCRKCGRTVGDAFYLYTASGGGEELAACLFEVQSDRVAAIYYEGKDPEDYFLFDGVLRAGLNYAWEQGVETGVIPEDFRREHRDMFAKLKYPSEAEMNIVNFFQKYKNCTGPGPG